MIGAERAMMPTELGEISSSQPTVVAIKQRAIHHAMTGHLVLVLVGLPFVVEKRIPLSIDEWCIALSAVLLVWGFLCLLLQTGFDRTLSFDPHFLLVPAGMSALLIGLFILLVPELRLLLLHGWYAVLLFGAGLFGFRDSLIMNTIMVATYLVMVGYLIEHGQALSWAFEISVIVPFYALCFFCSVILERLRRVRREMTTLRQQMAQLAMTDALTGLPNRRYLDEALARQAAQSRRTGVGYTLALLDVDHFKEINDSGGHEAGDHVLAALAVVLRKLLRRSDLVGRLGGDEFAILMPGTDLDNATRVMERVRSEVEAKSFGRARNHRPRHQVTVSIGLAQARADESPAEVMRYADDHLYVAKRCGRNRVAGIPRDQLDEVTTVSTGSIRVVSERARQPEWQGLRSAPAAVH